MMQTIQINNPEIERLLSSHYGDDTQSLVNDFAQFIKLSSSDNGYPTITSQEAKRRVAKSLEDIKNGSAILLESDEYDDEIDTFMKTL